MMPGEQSFGFGAQSGGSDLSSLMNNPLIYAGLGLLSAGRDRRIDPFQSAAQGLLTGAQMQQQQRENDMRGQQFAAQQQHYDMQRQQMQRSADAQAAIKGLLDAGDQEGAAKAAIASGDPHLVAWGGSQLTPKVPGELQTFKYLQDHPEMMDSFQRFKQASAKDPTPYFTALPTSTGYVTFDNRSGKYTSASIPGSGASGPLLPIPADVGLTRDKAAAEASGSTAGKSRAEAAINLPAVMANAQQTQTLIDQALNHPGLATATGMQGAIDPRNYVNGTDAKNFQVLLDQLKGKTFLEAYQGLKGAGAITDIEGNKAESAIGRLNRAQSTDEFKKSLNDLRDVVNAGMARSQVKAGLGNAQAAPAPAAAPQQFVFNPQTGKLEPK